MSDQCKKRVRPIKYFFKLHLHHHDHRKCNVFLDYTGADDRFLGKIFSISESTSGSVDATNNLE